MIVINDILLLSSIVLLLFHQHGACPYHLQKLLIVEGGELLTTEPLTRHTRLLTPLGSKTEVGAVTVDELRRVVRVVPFLGPTNGQITFRLTMTNEHQMIGQHLVTSQL